LKEYSKTNSLQYRQIEQLVQDAGDMTVFRRYWQYMEFMCATYTQDGPKNSTTFKSLLTPTYHDVESQSIYIQYFYLK